jgi:hypothetical protein
MMHIESVLGSQSIKVFFLSILVDRKKPAASLWSPLLLGRAVPVLFVESYE